ncbi:MAG: response regulator transcription factor [Planctomycetes bacterium]|nr:response regulator transcription factor [Planctomycetota bacterium]
MTAERVLVVDDDPSIRMVLTKGLKKDGFEVSQAVGGQEAIKIIDSESQFDLILLDVMMPVVDGRQVLEYIRSNKILATLPVIVLTAAGDEQTTNELLASGATDFVRKPFSLTEICARVRTHIGHRKAARNEIAVALGVAAAHHINQRLTTLLGNLELAMRCAPDKAEIREYLEVCREDAMMLADFVKRFSTLKDLTLRPYVGESMMIDLFPELQKET